MQLKILKNKLLICYSVEFLNFFIFKYSPIGTYSSFGQTTCDTCKSGYHSTQIGSKNCNICSKCPQSVNPPQCSNGTISSSKNTEKK